MAEVTSLLTRVIPTSGQHGQTLDAAINGQFTSFIQDVTTADFGPDITVKKVAVSAPASAIVTITIAQHAALRARRVTLTTGAQSASLANAFTVKQWVWQERLQPALLDRLTDEEPDKDIEGPDKRVLTKSQIREAVLRDLVWLFNTTRLESGADLANAPNVRRSVVNFGLPALSGATASMLDPMDLERGIRDAILAFEPRILPPSLRVQAIVSDTQLDQHNVISVQIEGHLWAQPVPLELLLRTEVDLETGKVEITELAKSRVA